MSAAKIAINYVLENEGGFADNPSDKGGPTNFGLSQKFLLGLKAPASNYFAQSYANQWKSVDRIREMTRDQAIDIYQLHIWKPIYGQIESQYICNYFFDMVVNHGEHEATLMLQRSLRALGGMGEIKDDGIFGPETIHHLAAFKPGYMDGGHIGDDELLGCMRATRAQYYRCLAKEPGQAQFLEGWLKRAYK